MKAPIWSRKVHAASANRIVPVQPFAFFGAACLGNSNGTELAGGWTRQPALARGGLRRYDPAMALDLDPFREKLHARRQSLAEEDRLAEADRRPVALDQDSVGRLSRIDAMQVQAMALAQQRRRQSERSAIDAALRRIEEGEFGYCLNCGEAIALPRLEQNPAATTCIACARDQSA